MKQIRNNVFETNSSSTHTLSIESKPVDEIMNDIFLRQKENYEPNCYREWCDAEEIVNNDILYINEYYSPSCDDCGDEYILIKSWLPKIMYAGLCVFDCLTNMYCNRNFFINYKGEDFSKETKDKINNNEIYKKYKKLFLNYAHSNNLYIKDIMFNVNKDYYLSTGDCNNFYETIEECVRKNDVETFESTIGKLMLTTSVIIDGDEAYHPYNRPVITIL